MIYYTTFIFTLLLAYVARAVPACGDVASPEDMYDPMYDDEQLVLATYKATWDDKYDNANGDTIGVVCSSLAPKYPHFKVIPHFPYIGGVSNIRGNSPNCGKCWQPELRQVYLPHRHGRRQTWCRFRPLRACYHNVERWNGAHIRSRGRISCFPFLWLQVNKLVLRSSLLPSACILLWNTALPFLDYWSRTFVLRKGIVKIVKVATICLYYLLHTCE
jgi:Cerato-platanin